MIKALRFILCRRTFSGIKKAEGSHSDLIHVVVHGFQIPQQHGPDKFIIGRWDELCKPSFYHSFEHNMDFFICQCESIFIYTRVFVECKLCHFQVPACKKKAPDSAFIMAELAVYNLFIKLCAKLPAIQQILHDHFHTAASFSDQLSDEAVAACICPISGKLVFA